jgi:DNA-nicking Smr family endonuclease
MTRRKTTDEERALFEETFKETRPHGKPAKTQSKPAPKTIAHASQKQTGGLDGNTAERLRKGTLDPDVRIDLHGMTEAAAHRALFAFLRNARRNGARLALVITGKGARRPDPYEPFDLERESRARGILKSMVPRWLSEPDFADLIADQRSAHIRHGGSGALYVYLKKKR